MSTEVNFPNQATAAPETGGLEAVLFRGEGFLIERGAQELVRQLLDKMPTCVFIKDYEGRFTYVNQAFEELYGIGKESVLGRYDWDVFQPNLIQVYRSNDSAILRGEELSVSEEHHIFPAGRTRLVRVWKRAVKHPVSGAIIGIFGVIIDATEVSKLKEELMVRSAELNEKEKMLQQAATALAQLQRASSSSLNIFISYRHTDDHHARWVRRLATDLMEIYGIPCLLDQFDLGYGDSIPAFMQKIKTEATHVLFIVTVETVAAVERNTGGVSFEAQLAAARRDEGKVRLIPILRSGTDTPAYVKSHLYIDFRDDDLYVEMLKRLGDFLLGRSLKPVLGSRTQIEIPVTAGINAS